MIPITSEYAREYQKAAAEYLLLSKKTILADEMGLGKTCSVITALSKLVQDSIEPVQVLIVTPAHLKFVWIEEFEKFADYRVEIEMHHRTQLRYYFIHPELTKTAIVTIINYDILHSRLPDLVKKNYTVLVCDESHYLKTLTTKRTKAVIALTKNIQSLKYIWLLSGTPTTKDAMDLFSQLKILNHPLAENYIYFAKKYANMKEVEKFGRKIKVFSFSNEDELRYELYSSCMIRRTKDQVLHELPEKTRQIIVLDSDEVEELINQEKEILKTITASEEEIDEILTDPMKMPKTTMLARVRQELALKKIPVVVNFIEEVLSDQNKVVVFAWHRTVIYSLMEALKKVYPQSMIISITGEDTQETKAKAIQLFQNHENPRILICSIAAVSTGVTLTAASTCIFIESDWIPAHIVQAEDRLHRIGQKNPVFVYHFTFDRSVESRILKKMFHRKEKIEKVLEAKHV
ncbi:MAG: DEAD/DEAH box helicase [Thermodesulfovibrio sp.]